MWQSRHCRGRKNAMHCWVMSDMSNINNIPFLATEIANEMLQRLAWVKLNEGVDKAGMVIVVLGPYASVLSEMLKAQYPHVTLIADSDTSVIFKLKPQSVDLLFALDVLPWVDDQAAWLTGARLILKPHGLLSGNAYGLDTFSPWQQMVSTIQKVRLVDMHDLGDQLLHLQFQDPVLDVERYTFTYKEKATLLQDIQYLLAHPLPATVANNMDAAGGLLLEVIYLHAFAPLAPIRFRMDEKGEVSVPVSILTQKQAK